MPTQGHVLTSTDNALKAFFTAAAIASLSDKIFRGKEVADQSVPYLVCASSGAIRKRAKNYEVTGSLDLKTTLTDDSGKITAEQLQASTDLEAAFLEAMESVVPVDDNPQVLGNAITAAAIAAGAVETNRFAMSACRIVNVSQGYDEAGIWTFSVDFTASVIV